MSVQTQTGIFERFCLQLYPNLNLNLTCKGISDTSSGYHEDYETSDGDEVGSSYNKVPDVIMEQDNRSRSV